MMKITKEDVDKLKQLDRIELRQKMILNYLNNPSDFYIIMAGIFWIVSLILSLLKGNRYYIILYTLISGCLLIISLYVAFKFSNIQKEIEEQYFKSEVKLK